MSFFGKIFGGKNEEKAVDTGTAIMNLRETENMLLKKQEFLEKKIDNELSIAKTNVKTNTRVAKQALTRKKRYEKQLQQIDGTLSTLEMQREALEGANTNTAVLDSMKEAADALKKAHKNMDIDQVHNMMDDIGEQQEIAREISDAISNPIAFASDVDEDDLEMELEKLEQEALDEDLLKTGPSGIPDLPVPIDEPLETIKGKKVSPKVRKEEDQEIKDLEMWAS